jgi:integrase/recombinase XerD
MSPLRQALIDYLAVRRSLGFKLGGAEGLLVQFVNYAEERGAQHLRISTMLAWATLPVNTHRN